MSLVPRSGRVCALAAWAILVSHAVISCSSNSARPAELGDCVKVGDAACTTPDPGGGTGGTGGESGAGEGGVVADTAAGCGIAQDVLTSQNTSCVPCVLGTSGTGNGCCGADSACSAQTACLNLLQCMVGCSLTDTTCANNCENSNPNGVQAYNDFAACLSQNCSPQCQTLPQGGTTDL